MGVEDTKEETVAYSIKTPRSGRVYYFWNLSHIYGCNRLVLILDKKKYNSPI